MALLHSLRKLLQHLPWPVVTLALVTVLLQAVGEPAVRWLQYERSAILDGQLWRLISGHIVHLGWVHLALNLVGLALLVAGFSAPFLFRFPQTFTVLFGLALGTSLGLLAFSDEMVWYVGLSGVLHGLALLLAVRMWQKERTAAGILSLGLIIKVGWEQATGGEPALEEAIGGAVVVDAHLYGVVSAALIAGALASWRRLRA